MICNECGGILNVIRVEEYPEGVKDKINYDRLCDVECLDCGKVFYSLPYDFGKKINAVKDLSQIKKSR
ncbi:hypothetical protein [Neobacillus ginsengisoli]|uniref:Uncharacterized protein n=1 Tax=Neobacillus ginsengisoli TaxID=904295 RepID=A0ABT9XNG8_9BACI|nr:hypothetical protein [Neobacillus ginsengisoli]MDQ0197092.1 hypothetical protein [Neobacillus ginsengisoli]